MTRREQGEGRRRGGVQGVESWGCRGGGGGGCKGGHMCYNQTSNYLIWHIL